jgi:hypothetical protein
MPARRLNLWSRPIMITMYALPSFFRAGAMICASLLGWARPCRKAEQSSSREWRNLKDGCLLYWPTMEQDGQARGGIPNTKAPPARNHAHVSKGWTRSSRPPNRKREVGEWSVGGPGPGFHFTFTCCGQHFAIATLSPTASTLRSSPAHVTRPAQVFRALASGSAIRCRGR